MCLHHQYSCSPPTLIIEKKSDILHLSLLSCCLEHRCQMFAVTTHPALSFSHTHTHTSTRPTAFRKRQQPLPKFKAADDDLSFACTILLYLLQSFLSPCFSGSSNSSSICVRDTHKCVLTPSRVEVMLAAGGHHKKTRKTRRGKSRWRIPTRTAL